MRGALLALGLGMPSRPCAGMTVWIYAQASWKTGNYIRGSCAR